MFSLVTAILQLLLYHLFVLLACRWDRERLREGKLADHPLGAADVEISLTLQISRGHCIVDHYNDSTLPVAIVHLWLTAQSLWAKAQNIATFCGYIRCCLSWVM